MYEGRLQLTVSEVARDLFGHLSGEKLLRKIDAGDIDLPLIRSEGSNKAARYVDIRDLAAYLDARRADAILLNDQIHGRKRRVDQSSVSIHARCDWEKTFEARHAPAF